jgi:hypothetical protein
LIINLFFWKWEAMLKSENKINYKSKEVKSNFFLARKNNSLRMWIQGA